MASYAVYDWLMLTAQTPQSSSRVQHALLSLVGLLGVLLVVLSGSIGEPGRFGVGSSVSPLQSAILGVRVEPREATLTQRAPDDDRETSALNWPNAPWTLPANAVAIMTMGRGQALPAARNAPALVAASCVLLWPAISQCGPPAA